MQIDLGENRFCGIKVSPLDKGQDDPMLIETMTKEIPAFLHFLINRKFHYPINKTRLAFDEEVYATELIHDVVERTGSRMGKEIKAFVSLMFLATKQKYIEYTQKDICNQLNENARFKYYPTQIGEYLKDEYNMKPEECKKYTFYSINVGENDEAFQKRITGRPYKFDHKDWLTAEEIYGMGEPDIDTEATRINGSPAKLHLDF